MNILYQMHYIKIVACSLKARIVNFYGMHPVVYLLDNNYLLTGQSTQQLFTVKQNKHYCVNICFLYACVFIPLHVSTLLLGPPKTCSIQALVIELL
jgi:hypothetical protein